MRGITHAIAEHLQVGLGDRRLDQRKDLVLLELNVVCESRSELVEQLESRHASEPDGVAADQHVVEEHSGDCGVAHSPWAA
jgi:hypothetical protein